ncbi:hypothetical protein CR513_48135, partial [Mucuna pruriens]
MIIVSFIGSCGPDVEIVMTSASSSAAAWNRLNKHYAKCCFNNKRHPMCPRLMDKSTLMVPIPLLLLTLQTTTLNGVKPLTQSPHASIVNNYNVKDQLLVANGRVSVFNTLDPPLYPHLTETALRSLPYFSPTSLGLMHLKWQQISLIECLLHSLVLCDSLGLLLSQIINFFPSSNCVLRLEFPSKCILLL